MNKRHMRLLRTAVVVLLAVALISLGALGEGVIWNTLDDPEFGHYQLLTIADMTPYVFMPTGAGSADQDDFMSVPDMAKAYGGDLRINAAINAGIFYNNGTPEQYCFNYREADGVVIAGGVVLKSEEPLDHTGCDILVIDEYGQMGWTDYYADADALARGYGYYYDIYGRPVVGRRIISAVTGFVPVVIGGVNQYDPEDTDLSGYHNYVGHYSGKAPRQIIGVRKDGTYLIMTSNDGWTLDDAAKVALKHRCVFAYNLDGGGSAQTLRGRVETGAYEIDPVYLNEQSPRCVPTYLIFTDSDAPVSATPERLDVTLTSDAPLRAGCSLSDVCSRLHVEELIVNANGKTSARVLQSALTHGAEPIEHVVIGGRTKRGETVTAADLSDRTRFPVRMTSQSPSGNLYYTKSESEQVDSIFYNGNTRPDGKYYDYSTGYTLSVEGDLSAPGEVTVTVMYAAVSGQPPLTASIAISVAE